jgi:hypothetical protein
MIILPITFINEKLHMRYFPGELSKESIYSDALHCNIINNTINIIREVIIFNKTSRGVQYLQQDQLLQKDNYYSVELILTFSYTDGLARVVLHVMVHLPYSFSFAF